MLLFTVADKFTSIWCKYWCWNVQNLSQMFMSSIFLNLI